jgi:hypothetical protein
MNLIHQGARRRGYSEPLEAFLGHGAPSLRNPVTFRIHKPTRRVPLVIGSARKKVRESEAMKIVTRFVT